MSQPARIARKARGWHPEEIKAAIRMKGSSMAELSRQHGYGISAVRQVLRRPWPAIEWLVADHLGVEPQFGVLSHPGPRPGHRKDRARAFRCLVATMPVRGR